MTDPITTPEALDVSRQRPCSDPDCHRPLGHEPPHRHDPFRPDAPAPTPAKCPTCWSSTASIRLPIGSIRRIKRCEDPWHEEAPTPASADRSAADRAADLYRWDTADDSTIVALRSAYVAGAVSEREVRPDAPTPTPADCYCPRGTQPHPHAPGWLKCTVHPVPAPTPAGDDQREALDREVGYHIRTAAALAKGGHSIDAQIDAARQAIAALAARPSAPTVTRETPVRRCEATKTTRHDAHGWYDERGDVRRCPGSTGPSAPTVTTEQIFVEMRRHGYEAGRPSVERCRCGQAIPWVGDATETMDRHRAEQVAALGITEPS